MEIANIMRDRLLDRMWARRCLWVEKAPELCKRDIAEIEIEMQKLRRSQIEDIDTIKSWIELARTSWSYIMGDLQTCCGPVRVWEDRIRKDERRHQKTYISKLERMLLHARKNPW
jgi:hypothetical protein